jgi:hypothetical protein
MVQRQRKALGLGCMVEVQGRSLAPTLVQLTQVPGHRSAEDNEIANQVARVGSERPFAGPEPACSFSAGVAKMVVTDWKNRDHKKYWESTTELKYAKGLLQGHSARRTWAFITGTRNHLWWVIGLLTGNCHLKRHLFKSGLMNNST